MQSIKIVTDSHSSISQKKAEELGIAVLPMPFMINGEEYLEDVTLSWDEFFEKMEEGAEVNTSQPSPEAVMGIWDRELKNHDAIVYIPISSGLSGSCNTAKMLAQDEKYEDKVYVVDNGRVATPMYRTILDALEMVQEGYTAEQIQKALEDARDKMTIYIAVDTLKYLQKGGRISSSTAVLGTLLNIKPILQFDVGMLNPYEKCRGIKAAKRKMIAAIKQDLETKFKEQYEKDEVYLLAATSADEEATEEWVAQIREEFPGMDVLCEKLSFGVSCHIGPNGFGIGFSCHPARPE